MPQASNFAFLAVHDGNLVQLGLLSERYSILTKAFRGELVPQDPNDEPASVLLGRIRAELSEAPKAKRMRRKQ